MRREVNPVVLAVLSLFLVACANASAQQLPAGSRPVPPTTASAPAPQPSADADQTVQELRTVMQSERRDIVNQLMDLTPEEHEKFWPVYSQYRADMTRVNNRLFVLIQDFAHNFDTLTDDKARSLLNENLSIEDAAHRVKASYIDRFAQALPAKKVARFFQIDNKIDVLVRAELAKDIPLVR